MLFAYHVFVAKFILLTFLSERNKVVEWDIPRCCIFIVYSWLTSFSSYLVTNWEKYWYKIMFLHILLIYYMFIINFTLVKSRFDWNQILEWNPPKNHQFIMCSIDSAFYSHSFIEWKEIFEQNLLFCYLCVMYS
jgi:hypothetical protein